MRHKPIFLFIGLSILLILVRVLVHVYFTGVYVDGDQTISWLGAVDKANGDWYTPYFYGQFYNISVESILSAPFIAMGFGVASVVPIISNMIGVAPFLFGAWFLYRRKLKNTAVILLCLCIILPAQYHFVTAMARGFAGGLAVFAVGLWLTGYQAKIIRPIGYALICVSYIVNPNVLIILAPLSLVWLLNIKNEDGRLTFNRLLPVLIGIGLASITFLWIQSFNVAHYEVHRLWNLEVSFSYLRKSLESLDARFLYLFPFLPKIGSLLLVLLVAINVILIVKKKRYEAGVMALSIVFVVVTLAVNKTSDGTYSTFFPFSRMYLALPFVAVLGVYLIIKGKSLQNAFYLTIVLLSVIGFSYQVYDIPLKAKASVRGNVGVVQVLTIDKLCDECEKMLAIQKKFKADLMVYHYKTDEYTYGCKAIQPHLKTLYPEYDRRYWEFAKHADTVYPTVLFMDWSLQLPKKLKHYTGEFEAIEDIHYPAFLLRQNTQSIIDLYQNNQLPLRPYSK